MSVVFIFDIGKRVFVEAFKSLPDENLILGKFVYFPLMSSSYFASMIS